MGGWVGGERAAWRARAAAPRASSRHEARRCVLAAVPNARTCSGQKLLLGDACATRCDDAYTPSVPRLRCRTPGAALTWACLPDPCSVPPVADAAAGVQADRFLVAAVAGRACGPRQAVLTAAACRDAAGALGKVWPRTDAVGTWPDYLPGCFEGDGGFAQAQVCLMEHAADAVVTASVAAATTQLYARAGINLQEALRAATSPGS